MASRFSTSLLVAVLVLVHAGGASRTPAAEPNQPRPGVSLTVYPEFGVVSEIRHVEIAADGSAELDDVAATIDPTSVRFESLTDPAAKVVEQNFQYDTVSALALIEAYVGKDVIVETPTRMYKGELIESRSVSWISYGNHSLDVGQLIIKDSSGLAIIRWKEVRSIRLAEMPKNLRMRPTLVWKVKTNNPGKQLARLAYQVEDLSWHAKYSLVLDEADTKGDMSAWVSVENRTGRAYKDARLKFMAGDVRREKKESGYGSSGGIFDSDDGPAMTERAMFEYHLYTLSRRVTMADREIKQVELFSPVRGVAVSKKYLYQPLSESAWGYMDGYGAKDAYGADKVSGKVSVLIQFKNSQANGLGIPLPAGKVSVYKSNTDDGGLEFLGENKIDHTPRDEELSLSVGKAFDIVGERTQTNAEYGEYNHGLLAETVEIVIRNQKDQDVNVRVREPIRRWKHRQKWGSWSIRKETHKHIKLDSHTIAWDLPVKARSQTKLIYTAGFHIVEEKKEEPSNQDLLKMLQKKQQKEQQEKQEQQE